MATDRELLKAAREAAKAMGLLNAAEVCFCAHHAKQDRHSIDSPCPVAARYAKALDGLHSVINRAAASIGRG